MQQFHVKARLEKVRANIRKIKSGMDNYKRPKDCLIHLSLLEVELEDQVYSLTH